MAHGTSIGGCECNVVRVGLCLRRCGLVLWKLLNCRCSVRFRIGLLDVLEFCVLLMVVITVSVGFCRLVILILLI